MMRLTLALILVLTGSPAARGGDGDGAFGPEEKGAWPPDVRGFGVTVEDAKNDAIHHLINETVAYLGRQKPPLVAWRPTIDFVKNKILEGPGRPGPDFVSDNVKSKTWVYPIKKLDLVMIAALDREAQRLARSQERIYLAVEVLGLLALGGGLFLGYVRLDDFTGGRYRRWFQVGAFLPLVGGAAWLWWP